jgi:hypothetical protein
MWKIEDTAPVTSCTYRWEEYLVPEDRRDVNYVSAALNKTSAEQKSPLDTSSYQRVVTKLIEAKLVRRMWLIVTLYAHRLYC